MTALQADDAATAEKELQALAKERDPRAQYLLGLFVYGSPTSKLLDVNKAAPLLLDASERGYTPAMIALAGLYAEGKGVRQSFFESYKWLAIAQRWRQSSAAPLMEQVAKELKPKGVEFVGINTRDFNKGPAVKFEEEHGVEYPSFYDPPGKLILRFPKGSLAPQQIRAGTRDDDDRRLDQGQIAKPPAMGKMPEGGCPHAPTPARCSARAPSRALLLLLPAGCRVAAGSTFFESARGLAGMRVRRIQAREAL